VPDPQPGASTRRLQVVPIGFKVLVVVYFMADISELFMTERVRKPLLRIKLLCWVTFFVLAIVYREVFRESRV
jgi:hypothetical protein